MCDDVCSTLKVPDIAVDAVKAAILRHKQVIENGYYVFVSNMGIQKFIEIHNDKITLITTSGQKSNQCSINTAGNIQLKSVIKADGTVHIKTNIKDDVYVINDTDNSVKVHIWGMYCCLSPGLLCLQCKR